MLQMNLAGIDFGTTNSYLALLVDGKIELQQTASGQARIPSRLSRDGDELYSIKRYLGRDTAELDDMGLHYVLEDGEARVPWNGKTYSPEDLAKEVFEGILNKTEVPRPLRAVLAVPAHYDEKQRRATERSARSAGIDVLRLIHEPTAAAIAFGEGQKEEKILVFDFGGGTLDLSLLETGGDVFEVLHTAGNRSLGGDDLDLLLAVEIAKRLEISFSHQVLLLAQEAKHQLSEKESTTISLEGSSQITLSRSELESIATPFLSEIETTLEEFRGLQFNRLIMVGGMSQVPVIRQLVEDYFSVSAEEGVDPSIAVAFGAARYMEALQGKNETLLLDITPMSLGIETESTGYSVLVPRGSRIPFSKERMFSTSRDDQLSVEVNILQGEEEDPSANSHLGKIWLRGIPPAPAGVPEIWVSFEINESGMLRAFVSESESGQTEEIEINLGQD